MDETRAAVRDRLLDARGPHGHWEGRLSSSALSTATAVTALAFLGRETGDRSDRDLVQRGIEWLLAAQNDDGGWGDTDRSLSNISTTALAWAALAFGERSERLAAAERAASAWLTRAAGSCDRVTLASAIGERYGSDRTFSVPILTMCTLAGRLGSTRDAWTVVPRLPFELALIPRRLFTVVRLPVVSYALPALIAMGLVRHRGGPPRNLLARAVRGAAARPALRVLESLQPPPGGFLEATPLTSFVAMSLVGAGEPRHPVVARAAAFLRQSARPDGSWPIDTNLATWVTTLAVHALAAGDRLGMYLSSNDRRVLRDWLTAQQTRSTHPYTGAAPGAWAWTDLPGGVPDADDTPGALLALHALGLLHSSLVLEAPAQASAGESGGSTGQARGQHHQHKRVAGVDAATRNAAAAGVRWLLDLQNRDGGTPTFCRGWGALPFDRSGADLTAHAVRAWTAWRPHLDGVLQRRVDRALTNALRYLLRAQRADGAFVPLWFGNQWVPGDENLTYGTSRVLLALCAASTPANADLSGAIARSVRWLCDAQQADGSWGGAAGAPPSAEETALATGALAAAVLAGHERPALAASQRGANWLVDATCRGTRVSASPIGFYFAKLWYYEELYPLIFVVEALERFSAARERAARAS